MRIGVVGDVHLPVSRVGYLDFCSDTFAKYKCDTIVSIGDMIDWHGISFHIRQPECPGPRDEYLLAYEGIQQWYKRFPNLKWCIGNHDERPSRLAKTVSIPEFMMKPYNEIWNVPGWEYDYEFVLDNILFKHGTGITGIHPAWNLMNKSRMSVVMGHCHSRCGIKWSVNHTNRYFAVDVGSGVDDRTWQFAYGQNLTERSVLACAVIDDGQPYSIIMKCGNGEKYHDSNFKKSRVVPIGKYGKVEEVQTVVREYPQKVHFKDLSGNSACFQCGGELTSRKEAVTCGNCLRTKVFKETND